MYTLKQCEFIKDPPQKVSFNVLPINQNQLIFVNYSTCGLTGAWKFEIY